MRQATLKIYQKDVLPKILYLITSLTVSDVNSTRTHNKCLSVSHQTVSRKRNTTKGLSLCAEFGFMDDKLYGSRNCEVAEELKIIVGLQLLCSLKQIRLTVLLRHENVVLKIKFVMTHLRQTNFQGISRLSFAVYVDKNKINKLLQQRKS